MFGRRKQSPEQSPIASRPASLSIPTRPDLITQARDGTACLYIIQDEPWTSSPEEIGWLSDKLSMYVEYILEGHIAEQYPHLAGRPWRIVIDSYTGRPDPPTMTALCATGDEISGLGGELIFHELQPPPVGSATPTTIRSVPLRTTREQSVSLWMARRSDPEPIFEAQRAGVRGRLTGAGMTPETADSWLDAWVLEATGRGLPRDGAYWQAGWDWIAEERAARRPGW